MAKRGRMSDEEKSFLDQYLESRTDEELAESLDRSLSFVSKYRKTRPSLIETEEEGEILGRLHAAYFWHELLDQLTAEELKGYEARWIALHQQFQDVLPTDQMQIKDLIILEMLINRVLTEKKQVISTIQRLEQQLAREEEKPIEFQDMQFMLNLETQLNAAMASQNARTTEHMKLQEKKDAKFKDLKATRDQRFKQLEDSRKSFFDLMRLLDQKETRQKEGHQIEIMRLAAENSQNDLSEYTEYDDGTVDKPMLNSDTSILGEEEK